MLLEIAKSVDLDVDRAVVWEVVRDPRRVAACLPNVRDFQEVSPGSYSASIQDKLGPFKVEVPVTITVTEDPAQHRMTADIQGADKRGQARIRGAVTASVTEPGTGSRVDLDSHIEVLGRLASLGAVPMRRRADQIFDVFVENLGTALRAGRTE